METPSAAEVVQRFEAYKLLNQGLTETLSIDEYFN